MKNLQMRAEPLPRQLDLMKHLHNKKQQNANFISWFAILFGFWEVLRALGVLYLSISSFIPHIYKQIG